MKGPTSYRQELRNQSRESVFFPSVYAAAMLR
jgi:hypothetical protein